MPDLKSVLQFFFVEKRQEFNLIFCVISITVVERY